MTRVAISLVIVALVMLALFVGYYVYSQSGAMTTVTQMQIAGTTLTYALTYTDSTTEMLTRVSIAGVLLTVELATTPAAQQLGLSYRASMPADHGMLFIFNQEGEWGFWMYEMRFPLDIIWFNVNRQVVFIEPDLPPCTPTACPVYTPPTNVTYVLEVNAGFVKTYGIQLGESFSFV